MLKNWINIENDQSQLAQEITVIVGEATSSFSNSMKNTDVDLYKVKSSYSVVKL